MSGINTLHQQTMGILMIFIMLVLPFLSISAFAHFDRHSMMQTASQAHTTQHSKHDCCDETSATAVNHCCKHCQDGDQCNCDSGQLSSSVALTMTSVLPEAIPARVCHRVISSSFRSKIADSLYRPPISLL